MSRSNAALGRELIVQQRTNRQALSDQQEWTLGALKLNQEELIGATRELHVSGILQERGIMPYVASPRSVLREEIHGIMAELELTEAQAKAWMVSQIGLMRATPPDNGATRTVDSKSGA